MPRAYADGTKLCPKCGTVKPVEAFAKNRSKPDGLQTLCRKCAAIAANQSVARYTARKTVPKPPAKKRCFKCQRVKSGTAFARAQRNPDGLQRMCRECYAAHFQANKDQYQENAYAWRAANIEKAREIDRRHYATHSQQRRENSRHWRRANPNAVRARDAQRRARKRNVTVDLTPAREIELRREWATRRYACTLCGEGFDAGGVIHLEHRIPLARGGAHSEENVGPAHAWCNSQKLDSTSAEWHGFLVRPIRRRRSPK
jgi:hypothetical protein